MGDPTMTMVVHGGAGREAVEERAPRRSGVVRAAEVGWAVLAAGGSALDATVEAVVILEDDPHFNAGRGAVLTVDGIVELDASVMAGDGARTSPPGSGRRPGWCWSTRPDGSVSLTRPRPWRPRTARAPADGS